MTLLQDLKYALRIFRNSPGFTAVAIATVALAIGANSAMFSFVDGTLLDPVPYPEPERIVRVFEQVPGPDGIRSNVATLNYLDWVEQSTLFEHMAAHAYWRPTMTGADEPLRIRAARVSASYFEINGTRPTLGRVFRPDEEQRGSDTVVLLSHALWESRFGADPAIVGREILLDGEAHTVIGVLPAGSAFDRGYAQLWKPLAFAPSEMTRDFHWFDVFAKLESAATLEQAQAEMDVIGERIAQEFPDTNRDWGVTVVPLAEAIIGPQLRTAVVALFAATALVLLIGCANLASLALARGIAREREIGVRASLGASRWRLARQFLTESLLLSACGGVVGIGIGYLTLGWLKRMLPPIALPAEVDLQMDTSVMLFALAASIVTGLLFGLAPAMHASRTDLVKTMKGGERGSTPDSPGLRLRNGLVVAEVALAFVLLVGAGLLMRSLAGLLDVDPGFDSENVLTAGLPLSSTQYPDPVELNIYLDSIRTAVAALPGVTDTAFTSALPLQGWGYGMPYQVTDREIIDLANRPWGYFKMVSPSYFETLRIQLRSGRPLSETDTASAPRVMVVNETFVQRNFPNEDPIGKQVLVQQIVPGQLDLGPEVAWEIVGVAADEKVNGLGEAGDAGMYVTNAQSPVYLGNLVVRAALDPQTLQASIRSAVDGINANQALSSIRTLEQIEVQSMATNRMQSMLFGLFAGVALMLAAIGIYGVISYAVVQRTREMGIRAALGASVSSLLGLVLRGGMRLVCLGLAIGVVAALATTHLMSSLLYGVSGRDPITIAAVAVVLGGVAALACFVPARRITKVDPNAALRYE